MGGNKKKERERNGRIKTMHNKLRNTLTTQTNKHGVITADIPTSLRESRGGKTNLFTRAITYEPPFYAPALPPDPVEAKFEAPASGPPSRSRAHSLAGLPERRLNRLALDVLSARLSTAEDEREGEGEEGWWCWC